MTFFDAVRELLDKIIRHQRIVLSEHKAVGRLWSLRLALRNHRILFGWAIFCIAIFGGLPASFRVVFAKCDIADPQDRMVEIALNTLRGWEYSLLAGLVVVLWNTIWFRLLEEHAEYSYDVWVAFILRQTADYFMWSIVIALLTSTMYNRIHDLILHPHRGQGVCRISFDWRLEDAWMFLRNST